MNTTTATAAVAQSATPRLPALALASLLTLAMLMGVNSLARVDHTAPQLAQASQARA